MVSHLIYLFFEPSLGKVKLPCFTTIEYVWQILGSFREGGAFCPSPLPAVSSPEKPILNKVKIIYLLMVTKRRWKFKTVLIWNMAYEFSMILSFSSILLNSTTNSEVLSPVTCLEIKINKCFKYIHIHLKPSHTFWKNS